jgi:drug/metabolite transporter (DMT)-like permease
VPSERSPPRVTVTSNIDGALADRPARRERIPLGILYMVAATVLFAGSSAASKWLVEVYPVGEVLWVRTVASLVGFSLVILPQMGPAVLRTRRLRDHTMRGVSQATSQTLLLIAFSMMPLASATAINFSAPLFATLIAILFLKEVVGWARWTALVVGFVGVLVVTNPGAETFQLGALFALGNAVLFGTVTVAVRGMTATESSETLTMYQMLVLTALFSLFLPFGFVTPTWEHAAIMVMTGLVNGLGQYWWTRSLHLAPTSAVTPFSYLSLVWAMALGFLVWGDVPTVALLIGSAILVGSGLFLLWRETRATVPPAAGE